uniref:hypothetical protein n=1 Tax=Mesomycoplasma ovipneumoniae TaxID=29562 RepID=UPI00311A5B9B
MNKSFFSFLIAIIAACSGMNAATVTESQARAIAGEFFGVAMPQQPAAMKAKAKGGAATPFY